MRVFVAGASKAIREPLIAELLERGHSVVGITTSEARAKNLQAQGADAVIVDAFRRRWRLRGGGRPIDVVAEGTE
jgi:nucleoside-diphosphate-sugar epimerase